MHQEFSPSGHQPAQAVTGVVVANHRELLRYVEAFYPSDTRWRDAVLMGGSKNFRCVGWR